MLAKGLHVGPVHAKCRLALLELLTMGASPGRFSVISQLPINKELVAIMLHNIVQPDVLMHNACLMHGCSCLQQKDCEALQMDSHLDEQATFAAGKTAGTPAPWLANPDSPRLTAGTRIDCAATPFLQRCLLTHHHRARCVLLLTSQPPSR